MKLPNIQANTFNDLRMTVLAVRIVFFIKL